MKVLISTILASIFIVSCSSNSSNDNSSNSTDVNLLLKSVANSSGTSSFYYIGTKLNNVFESSGGGINNTFSYNGDLIVNMQSSANTKNMNYSNNLLISESSISPSYNYSYQYNVDGSVTEIRSNSSIVSGTLITINSKSVRFFYQGNCIKEDKYSIIDNVETFMSSNTYTYDDKKFPTKNITGFYQLRNSQGFANNNNPLSIIRRNSSGVITSVSEFTYVYNSQNYPLNAIENYTPYILNSLGTSSVPGTPAVYSTMYTYY
jgi:hypothetical protein